MKYECGECKKVFNENKVIFVSESHNNIYAHYICLKCYSSKLKEGKQDG